MASRSLARSESGFALIEAVVSAAVLAIVAMAVLSGIDTASSSSAREKARSVAANLAEQDQERLRSMSITSLAALGANPPVVVDGVKYTVTSKAVWVTDDSGGTPSCGNSSKNNDYMHITSTVTSSIVGQSIKAVRIDSLVAPSVAYSSTHGTLGVKVVDRNGIGVPGIVVSPSMTSPSSYAPATLATDSQGCALFRTIPIGTYAISISASGYVDPDGNFTGAASQKVSPGTVSFKTMDYDRETKAGITIKTNVPGTPATAQSSKALKVSATNAKRTGMLRTYSSALTSSTFTAAQLFPFKDSPYAFFTGGCGYESPDVADPAGNGSYFGSASHPGLQMDPTLTQPQTGYIIWQPPFNLRVTKNAAGTTTLNNLTVYATLQKPTGSTDTCTEPRVQMAFKTWPGGSWGAAPGNNTTGWVVQNDAAGFDPGMPFGSYQVCVRDSGAGKYALATYNNTVPGGQTSNVNFDTAHGGIWTNGSCP